MIQYDTIRLVAILSIVLLHVAANGVNHLALGSADWWLANAINSACRAGVPLFLMLSGALLLKPVNDETRYSIRNFYRRRWQRIALPVVFWSLFYLGWSQFKAWWKNQPLAIDDLWHQLFSGQPYFHLWYLYMLIGLYAVLPWFGRYWQRLDHRQQLALLLASLCLQQCLMQLRFFQQDIPWVPDALVMADQLPWPLWFIGYLPYVMLGAVLAKQWQQPLRPSRLWLGLWLGLLICAITTIALGYASQRFAIASIQAGPINLYPFSYSYHYLNWPVVFCAVCYWQVLRHWQIQQLPKLATQIVTYSFGIYLVHPVWLDMSSMVLQQPVFHQIPYSWQLLAQSTVVLAASAMSCSLWFYCKSTLKKVSSTTH